MDKLIYSFSKKTGISFIYTDLTDLAKKLEQTHLSGPTAGRFLGETLVAVSLLSADLGSKDERISIQVRVDGPVGGSCADASREGNIRGYTFMKILNDVDEIPDAPIEKILGKNGELTVIRSTPRNVISQDQIRCNPMNLCHALARYCNDRLNEPTGIEISVVSENFTINKAAGVRVSRTKDGNCEAFVNILERLNDKTIKKALSQGIDLETIGKTLGLDDLKVIEERPLDTKCSCSKEKVLYTISCLPEEDLLDMIAKKECPEVSCHFCSTTYHVSTEEVAHLLRNKK